MISTPRNAPSTLQRWPMSGRHKILLVLSLIVIVPVAVFALVMAFRNPSGTIGAVLAEQGFVEFRPPSNLIAPGHWVQVTGSKPLHLSVICASLRALGFPDDFEPLSSVSVDAAFSRSLETRFTLAAGATTTGSASSWWDAVESVTFSLANVRVVEVADDQVREAVLNRGKRCHEAIKARFKEKLPVTMIKSALVADGRYEVAFRQGLDEALKIAALRELALEFDLRTAIGEASSSTLMGHGLVWGVREDSRLASVGIGLPSTGGSGDGESVDVLHGLGPVVGIDESTQAGGGGAHGRRGFPDGEVLIRHDVVPLRQSSRNACWATVYAMMAAWREEQPISVTDAVRGLGEPFIDYYLSDLGLPGGAELEFVRTAGMNALPPASYPMTAFARFLRDYGPLWITSGDGISSHARLLVGIYGKAFDETPEAYRDAVFELIDPSSGTYVYESAVAFEHFFELEANYIVGREDDVDLRWQILHWPD